MFNQELIEKIINNSKLISLNSKNNPIVIFDENKKVYFVNKLYKKNFVNDYNKSFIDYFFMKEKEKFVYFFEFEIERLLDTKNNIFHYRDINDIERAFKILTFDLGKIDGKNYYIAFLLEVTDCKERFIDETMNALLKASQMKDNDTGEHTNRLNEYSKILAEYIYKNKIAPYCEEIDQYFIKKIGKVASMHDVGKIGIPDSILAKPGKLTDEEFVIMKEHTINGAFILSGLAGKMARDIALFHHEKWDGSGYPYGLKEDQIPLSARIVAVCDVYDALRMKRCYKPSFSQEKTIDIIKSSSGTHFDPVIVEVFLKVSHLFNNIFLSMATEEEKD